MINYNYPNLKNVDQETKELIADFAILWNCFEKKFFNKYCSSRKIKDAIVKKMSSSDELFERLKEECNKEFYLQKMNKEYKKQDEIDDLTNKMIYIFVSKGNNLTLEIDEENIKYNISKDNTKFLIEIVYRIRCNLFHGPKEIVDLNSQKKLFEIANEFLCDFLENGEVVSSNSNINLISWYKFSFSKSL